MGHSLFLECFYTILLEFGSRYAGVDKLSVSVADRTIFGAEASIGLCAAAIGVFLQGHAAALTYVGHFKFPLHNWRALKPAYGLYHQSNA